VQENLSRKAII